MRSRDSVRRSDGPLQHVPLQARCMALTSKLRNGSGYVLRFQDRWPSFLTVPIRNEIPSVDATGVRCSCFERPILLPELRLMRSWIGGSVPCLLVCCVLLWPSHASLSCCLFGVGCRSSADSCGQRRCCAGGEIRKREAVFAGGCFWGTQSVFERVKGVLSTTSLFRGSAETATYDQVTTETTVMLSRLRWLRSVEDHVRPAAADLLLRGAPSYAAQSSGPDVGLRIGRDFLRERRPEAIAQAYIAQLDAAKVFPKRL